jgi:hypothetical protein
MLEEQRKKEQEMLKKLYEQKNWGYKLRINGSDSF